MSEPLVSFVVPCYKLGHYLAECVDSILSQTYKNLEVLIMDDCSPDNTPEVARSFKDPRVRYIRNEPNLGHLNNYNKGIEMCRGKYVWLISADDRLRRPYVLEQYVHKMELNPQLGFMFCPAVRLENGCEGEVLDYSVHASQDTIFEGREFLKRLIKANTIVAPTAMVRKVCYERISKFPLDMPWGGDWYLWFVFAVHFDVGYLAEPMVYYRRHTGSMTNTLTTRALETCRAEDVAMPWVMKHKLEQAGLGDLTKLCLQSAAEEYARNISSKGYRTATSISVSRMTLKEFEKSLAQNSRNRREKRWIRARVYAGLADRCRVAGRLPAARQLYGRALINDPLMTQVWANLVFLFGGRAGARLREHLKHLRPTEIGAAQGR